MEEEATYSLHILLYISFFDSLTTPVDHSHRITQWFTSPLNPLTISHIVWRDFRCDASLSLSPLLLPSVSSSSSPPPPPPPPLHLPFHSVVNTYRPTALKCSRLHRHTCFILVERSKLARERINHVSLQISPSHTKKYSDDDWKSLSQTTVFSLSLSFSVGPINGLTICWKHWSTTPNWLGASYAFTVDYHWCLYNSTE